jgi:hypothetical protein
MRKATYQVQYWDAYGNAHTTHSMDYEMAKAFASSMNAEQEAQIILVYINI